MAMREKSLGKNVSFLLPSLKLKNESGGETLERRVHTFLLENFGGYTATAANVFGYWKDDAGASSYGEHREFTVALVEDERLGVLKEFLGRTAREMEEESLYVVVGGVAMLVYGE
jgi:hypothetical protein